MSGNTLPDWYLQKQGAQTVEPDVSLPDWYVQRQTAQATAPTTPAPSIAGIGGNGIGRAYLRAVPVLGGLVDKGLAAIDAGAAPFIPGAGINGDTFGQRYNDALTKEQTVDQTFDRQHPYVSTAAKAAGVASTAGVPLPGPAADAALWTKMGAGYGTGSAVNGADAYIRSNGDPAAAERGAVIGGVLGAAAPVVGAVAGRFVGGSNPAAALPKQADLNANYDALYKSADASPFTISPGVASVLNDDAGQEAIQLALKHAKIGAPVDPIAARQASELQGLLTPTGGVISPGGQITAGTADAIHQAFGNLGAAPGMAGTRGGKYFFQRAGVLDDTLNQIPGMSDARSAYRTAQNYGKVQDAIKSVQNAGNTPAAYKATFNKLLNDDVAKWSPEQEDAIRTLAQGGGTPASIAGQLTKLSHGFVGNMLALKGVEENPELLAIRGVGELAAPAQRALLSRQANNIANMTANGGQPVAPRQFDPGVEDLIRRLAIGLGPSLTPLPRPSGQ